MLGGVAGYYTEENSEIATAINSNIKLLSNDYVSKNSEIPTIGHMAYNRTYENGKYIVNYLGSYTDCFYQLKSAFETASAKELISKNRQKNDGIKLNVENEIASLEILNNEERIQEELRIEREKNEINDEEVINEDNEELENKSAVLVDYLIIGSFSIGILLCLVMLVCINKKKKSEK